MLTVFYHLSPTTSYTKSSIINLQRISDHEEMQTLITSTFVKGWPDVYSFYNTESILYLDFINIDSFDYEYMFSSKVALYTPNFREKIVTMFHYFIKIL